MYSQATVNRVLVVQQPRLLSGSLVAPAYEVSGAPPGGEVIPEPYGWMGQTNLNWWGLWVLAPCLGGKVFLLPPPGGGTFTALRAWELAVLVRAGRGTMTAFVTMEHAGLVPQGGKIESLPTERKRLQLGCVRITRSPKQQSGWGQFLPPTGSCGTERFLPGGFATAPLKGSRDAHARNTRDSVTA